MITKEMFLRDFGGHINSYSSYMVIDVELDNVISALNDIDSSMCVGSGKVSDSGRSIYFEVGKGLPDLIKDITARLHCKGFACIGGWYGGGYCEASYDGKEFNGFTAEWVDGAPERRDYDYSDFDYDNNDADAEMLWDAFVRVTDNESRETFYTGEGACDCDVMLEWAEFVNTHNGCFKCETKTAL